MKEPRKRKQDRKMENKMKRNKGITLIALVITIIVLLILAGVSIATLTGENGILTQATTAKKQTEIAEAKEQAQLDIAAWRAERLRNNENSDLTNDIIKGILTGKDYVGTVGDNSFTTEKNGYEVLYSDLDKDISGEPSIAGTKYEEETDITVEDTPVTVPAKFTISGVPEESTVENGLVIYLIPDGETVNWEDPEAVKNAQKNYDQFVWVPVPNAIAEDKNGDGVVDASDIDKMIEEEKYPMAIATDSTNYRGILYDFTLTDGKVVVSDKTYSATSGYREPAYLTSASSYNDVGITESSLQSEFNTMVNKVANHKGFWVGRYETSNMSNSSSNDATQQIKVVKETTTGINNVNWYRMYAQQKKYAELTFGASNTTTSSMIWGSQWDQIMIWMKGIDNEAQNSKYVVNSIGMGNFGNISGIDDGWSSTSAPAPTGNSEDYKVKNVYDLAGNVYDWTLEANSTNYRVKRGGYYVTTDTSFSRAGYRFYGYPNDFNSSYGSRSSLY